MRSPAKNFILLSSSELLSKALGFFTTVLIARRAGVSGLGEIGFVLALYTYFTLLANPGYDIIGARETAKKESDDVTVINAFFVLKFLSSVAAFLVLTMFCFLVPFSSTVKQLLLLQGLTLLTIPFSFQFYFRGANQMQIVALSRFLQSALYCAAVYAYVHGSGDLMRVPIAFGVSTVVGLLPMAGMVSRYLSFRHHIPRKQVRAYLVSAVTLGAAAICIQVYLDMDTVLLGFFKTSYEVGLYTSAYKIVTLASTIPMLLFTSYLPYLQSVKDNPNDWKKYVLTMVSAGLLVGIVVALFAPVFISLLYGAEYQGAVVPLRILSIDIIAVFFSITFAQPLMLLGKEKQYLSIVAWSAGLNIACNLILIPLLGMTGAAVTTVGAEGMVAFRIMAGNEADGCLFIYKGNCFDADDRRSGVYSYVPVHDRLFLEHRTHRCVFYSFLLYFCSTLVVGADETYAGNELNYRSYTQLHEDIRQWALQLPKGIELVAGIPKSGLLVANILCMHLQLPMADLEGFLAGRIFPSGERLKDIDAATFLNTPRTVLVVDDSVDSGTQMERARSRIAEMHLQHKIMYGALYASTLEQMHRLDYSLVHLPQPRFFEWNLFHTTLIQNSCIDIDGVLCRDPLDDENDDGEQYIKFIRTVQPLVIPSVPIGWLVTCRLEKYRAATVDWLQSHGIRYNQLLMMDYQTKEQRQQEGAYASFKAGIYKTTGAALFIESSGQQAGQIATLAGKVVYCTESSTLFQPSFPDRVKERIKEEVHKTRKYPLLRLKALFKSIRWMLKRS